MGPSDTECIMRRDVEELLRVCVSPRLLRGEVDDGERRREKRREAKMLRQEPATEELYREALLQAGDIEGNILRKAHQLYKLCGPPPWSTTEWEIHMCGEIVANCASVRCLPKR